MTDEKIDFRTMIMECLVHVQAQTGAPFLDTLRDEYALQIEEEEPDLIVRELLVDDDGELTPGKELARFTLTPVPRDDDEG